MCKFTIYPVLLLILIVGILPLRVSYGQEAGQSPIENGTKGFYVPSGGPLGGGMYPEGVPGPFPEGMNPFFTGAFPQLKLNNARCVSALMVALDKPILQIDSETFVIKEDTGFRIIGSSRQVLIDNRLSCERTSTEG